MSNMEERIADRHLDKITINYFDKLVQITCDEALKNYLEEPGNGALELSAHILNEYKKRQKSELKISKDSLAIEILAHTYADIFSETVASVYKGQHAPNRVISAIFCVILNRRTSSTPLSSALKITEIPAVGVFES